MGRRPGEVFRPGFGYSSDTGHGRAAVVLRFGESVFDGEAREVRRGAQTVVLSPKAFQLLGLLLEARPRALRQQELRDALWPDTHVSHTSLPRVVTELRAALGDDPKAPLFVRTVHGFGYAFRAGSEEPGSSPVRFRLVWSRREIPLPFGEMVVGRGVDCGLRLDSPRVSRHHARIRVTGSGASVEDLGSKNGTTVRGERIEGEVALRDGDEIVIGPAELLFRGSADGSTETAPGPRPSNDAEWPPITQSQEP
jgi:DNA-binding winged helix-turn-helix (wHTH) protein